MSGVDASLLGPKQLKQQAISRSHFVASTHAQLRTSTNNMLTSQQAPRVGCIHAALHHD